MKVLFLGATGIIGRQVVSVLREDFDLTLAAYGADIIDGHPVSHCDITDFSGISRLFGSDDFDAVVNCAIADRHSVNMDRPDAAHDYAERCIDVNTRGAYHVFEAASRAGISRCVFISSLTAVMGDPLYDHVDRDALPRPRNLYACTKLFGEQLGHTYAYRALNPLQVLCLRLGQPFKAMRESDRKWNQSAFSRSMMVHYQDIAQAIDCALRTDVRFGVYPILSASDGKWIDQSGCAELGYSPRWTFCADGSIEPQRDFVMS